MTTYARVQDGVVMELIVVDGEPPIEERFHPDVVAQTVALRGAQVTNVTEGYLYDGTSFSAPPVVEPPVVVAPTFEELMAQIQVLMEQAQAMKG